MNEIQKLTEATIEAFEKGSITDDEAIKQLIAHGNNQADAEDIIASLSGEGDLQEQD